MIETTYLNRIALEAWEYYGIKKCRLPFGLPKCQPLCLLPNLNGGCDFGDLWDDCESFSQNKEVARQGGHVAGTARKEIEAQTGESIISPKNAENLRLENKKI